MIENSFWEGHGNMIKRFTKDLNQINHDSDRLSLNNNVRLLEQQYQLATDNFANLIC